VAALLALATSLAAGAEPPPDAGPPALPASIALRAPDLAPAPPTSLQLAEPAPLSPAAIALRMAGGAATAFVAHESCHVLTNLALGNRPTFRRVTFLGSIPFFSISPDITCSGGTCRDRSGGIFGPGPRGYYAITSAGLQCGHLEDELLLTAKRPPSLERDPFLSGALAFNIALAAGYATADLAGAEPPSGDLHGMRDAGAPRRAMVGLVLGAAALDAARWIWPGHAWLDWASRAAKVGTTGLIFTM
jgi:hypothetical protein